MHWGGDDLSLRPWQGKSFCFHPNNQSGAYILPGHDCHRRSPINVTPAWQCKFTSNPPLLVIMGPF